MKARLLGIAIATLIRLVGMTLRFEVVDRPGIRDKNPDTPLIWLFWHNRLFVMPFVYRRYLPRRSGSVLTSPSGDGELITQVLARFGVGAVRGSSNKRPAAALKELVSFLRTGGDVSITPDGPRGPRYRLQPGAVKLAQLSGARIFPIHAEYTRVWRLKTWDQFRIPVPFSRVRIVLDELVEIPRRLDPDAFEEMRAKVEQILLAHVEDPVQE